MCSFFELTDQLQSKDYFNDVSTPNNQTEIYAARDSREFRFRIHRASSAPVTFGHYFANHAKARCHEWHRAFFVG